MERFKEIIQIPYKIFGTQSKPTKHFVTDAGFDLYAPKDLVIRANSFKFINLEVAMCIPQGNVGFLLGRSGLAKAGLHVFTGVIDAGFVGSLGATIFNASDTDYEVKAGDRICQLVITPLTYAQLAFNQTDVFEKTERGSNGFGSSGK